MININKLNKKYILDIFYLLMGIGDWGLGIGDWGLGIGDWAQSPIPNPQTPIPNPQILFIYLFIYLIFLI